MRKPTVGRALLTGVPAVLALALIALAFSLVTGSPVRASSDLDDCRASNIAVRPSTWSAPGWTAAENRRPGTTEWRPQTSRPADPALEGFSGQVSVAPGARFTLYVRSQDQWRWSAYRLGSYGGAGGRLYGGSCWNAPTHQPQAVVSPATRTVTAPWKRTLTIKQSWPPGLYLVKLTDTQGRESSIPLLVRSPSAARRTVFMYSAMTMQAYNHWGGHSLYVGPDGSSRNRAYADSFDRPYDGHFAMDLLAFEQPLIAESERLGLPLAYLTDIDVATRPQVLAGARAVMTDGHDEYWTLGERQAVIDASKRGTNLLFFGANQLWWQARLGSTSLGAHRLVICYKYAHDPIARTQADLRTTHFRDLARSWAESRLVGVQYAGLGANAPFVVYRPDFFAFAHTGAHRGSAYPGLVGPEIDTVNPGIGSPRNLEIVGRSPANCHRIHCLSEATYYTLPSGAAVWAAGTDGWVNALGNDTYRVMTPESTRAFARTVTDNLLLAFARGPAGRVHPPKPNVRPSDGPPARSLLPVRELGTD